MMSKVDDEAIREEILTSFSNIDVKLSQEMLLKCVLLVKRLRFTGMKLADAWEAHTLNNEFVKMDEISFDSFQKGLLKSASQLNDDEREGAVVSSFHKRRINNDLPTMIATKTPEKKLRANVIPMDITDDNRTTSFQNRTDSCKILIEYNPNNLYFLNFV